MAGLNILNKFIDNCDDRTIFYLDERVEIEKNKEIILFL